MARTIVFQGDSITDVGRDRDLTLPANLGMGSGYPFLTMTQLRLTEPEKDWQVFNRGISGNRIVDLYARWKREALNLKPDILSILIGVNDTWHESAFQNGVEVPRYARIYRELLEWTKSTLPSIKFVLLEPYVLEFGAVGDDWLAEIDARRKVVRKLAKDFDAILIPTQDILNKAAKRVSKEYWLADGVHPLLAGHQLIADAWLKAVKF